jgi:hypothetical protein
LSEAISNAAYLRQHRSEGDRVLAIRLDDGHRYLVRAILCRRDDSLTESLW